MGITIADCLKLPALRDAQVIAGHLGLNQFVSTVSVLEYAHIPLMAEELFLGNELILTAFVSVKDSVEDQCKALRKLCEVGEAGIVLYYVGFFVKNVSPQLIEVADELHFPLILMPPHTYHHRYSEVITEVLEAIFEDQKKETYFVTGMLEQIARLRERQRGVDGVLRLLSDRLRCTFLLTDRNLEQKGFASWPMVAKSEMEQIQSLFLDGAGRGGLPLQIEREGRKYNVYQGKFDTEKQRGMRLFALDEGEILTHNYFNQAVELIQAYGSIWKENFLGEDMSRLVRAILNDQPMVMSRIGKTLGIDLAAIRIMWVIKKPGQEDNDIEEMGHSLLPELIGFLKKQGKRVLADTFDEGIVVFMDEAKYPELDMGLADEFMEKNKDQNTGFVLFWCGDMNSTQDVRMAYMLIERYFPTVCMLYPSCKRITLRELRMAKECMEVIDAGEEEMARMQKALLPLYGQKDTEDLLNTLSVYLIDANKNVMKTAELLFVHESTVKYRLNKIRQKLGFEIDRMPGEYHLYFALALNRIL